jgi:ABC-type glycerol-3-phosphate transport system substrate-binding protein
MRKNFKIFSTITAVLSLLLSSALVTTSSSSAADKKPAAINVYLIPSPSADAIKKLAPAWTAKTGIKVNFTEVEYGTAHQKALLSIQTGKGEQDVVQFDNTFLAAFANAKALTQLDAYTSASKEYDMADFTPALQHYGDFGGKKFGLMLSTEPFIQWYRSDIYKSLNLKPAKTWNEYKVNADAIQKSGKAAGQLLGYGQGSTWWWMQMIWSFGGKLYDAKFNPTVDTTEAIAATKLYKDLLSSAPKGALGFSGDDVTIQFVSTNIGQILQYSGYASGVFDPKMSKNSKNIAVTSAPSGTVNAIELAGWNIGIPSDSKNKTWAWNFLEYMLGKTNAPNFLNAGAAAIGRTSITTNKALVAKNPYLALLSLPTSATVYTYPSLVTWPEFDKVSADALASILSGKVTVENGLKKLNASLKIVLAKEPKR